MEPLDDYDPRYQCPHIAFDLDRFLSLHPDPTVAELAAAVSGADTVYAGITIHDVTAVRQERLPDVGIDESDDYAVLDLVSQWHDGITDEQIESAFSEYLRDYLGTPIGEDLD
jgi:hypothetical protein